MSERVSHEASQRRLRISVRGLMILVLIGTLDRARSRATRKTKDNLCQREAASGVLRSQRCRPLKRGRGVRNWSDNREERNDQE
jgi:hypothetical protein